MNKTVGELREMAGRKTSDRILGPTGQCFEKINEGGEDALFFEALMNVLLVANASEAGARLARDSSGFPALLRF